jgi:transcriptional regulator with XRE-family HTH domain
MSENESSYSQRFGEKLRTLRKMHNLTREQLAEAFGYKSENHITLLETGKRNPTAQLIVKVSLYFGVSTDVLLRDDLDLDGDDNSE